MSVLGNPIVPDCLANEHNGRASGPVIRRSVLRTARRVKLCDTRGVEAVRRDHDVRVIEAELCCRAAGSLTSIVFFIFSPLVQTSGVLL